jgi:hypothetical protein
MIADYLQTSSPDHTHHGEVRNHKHHREERGEQADECDIIGQVVFVARIKTSLFVIFTGKCFNHPYPCQVLNTLFGIALEKNGIDAKKYLEQTTLIGFAFNDAPALAKVVNDAAKTDFFKVKGGLLGKNTMSTADVKALADMPPLPVVRAQLLGVLSAPASKLVRTINEPARGLAAVVKAHSEKEEAPAAE